MSKEKLYDSDSLQVMKVTKDSINKSRIKELIDFAKNSDINKIGVANCLSMEKYAQSLKEILKQEGFDVITVNCKDSGLTNADLFGEEVKGLSCDPAHQAKVLNDSETELNINIGLCLGHGLVFNKNSNAPVTTLIVKDFSTKHNTAKEL
ncbi:MAG: DUF1847 domain-containing protein [Alphaproteobacteria bacterium]|jgi:uncharacterized metal-binding protein|nr:DUF1847 domain-containing protein [Alphaproteobacteria bacterium]